MIVNHIFNCNLWSEKKNNHTSQSKVYHFFHFLDVSSSREVATGCTTEAHSGSCLGASSLDITWQCFSFLDAWDAAPCPVEKR